MSMKKFLTVSVCGNNVDLPFKDFSDGCIGMIPVFNTREQAVEFMGNESEVQEIVLGEPNGEN